MTRLIVIFILIVGVYCGYQLVLRWDRVRTETEAKQAEAAAAAVRPENLPGLPFALEPGLKAAQQQGPAAFRNWLRTYERTLQDPRRAWIELDYCVAIARDDPSEARRVFASVKARTPASSPVWPRIKDLERSYE